MTPEQIGKALRRMRELIANGHWTQGLYQSEAPLRTKLTADDNNLRHVIPDSDVVPGQTCFCIAGALDYVLVHEMGKRPGFAKASGVDFEPMLDALFKYLPEHAKKQGYSVVANVINYNDHPARTEADMLALLDRAIADYPQ